MNDLTFFESLKVAWFITWRSFVIGVALGIFALMVGIPLGVPKATLFNVLQLLVTPVSVFVVFPILLRLALRKQYEGFKLQVVREAN